MRLTISNRGYADIVEAFRESIIKDTKRNRVGNSSILMQGIIDTCFKLGYQFGVDSVATGDDSECLAIMSKLGIEE